jgi:predicted enzyme related to lactoylglutathione lyase
MPQDVHFDIPVDNPERAQQFYTQLFGWKLRKVSLPGFDYWLLRSAKDENLGGMLQRTSPGQYPVNFFPVTDMDAAIQQVINLGGRVVVPKKAIPRAGYSAQVTDTEGNIFGLWQNDSAAQ